MTALVRKFQNFGRIKGWPIHKGPRSNVEAMIEAADRDLEEQSDDTARVVGQTLQIIEREKQRDADR